MTTATETLFATTTPGLERPLSDEVRALGWRPRVLRGGVEWDAPPGAHARANLWLRSANRVWLRTKPSDLRRYWNGQQAVTLESSGPQARQAEQNLRRAHRMRSPKAGETETLALLMRSERGGMELSVDSTGELLYRRGYRQEVSRAPMRETLAAGLLALCGWSADMPLWDPLCGSGTFAIEAALISRRFPPGAARSFAFEQWPSHDAKAWAALKSEAASQQLAHARAPIWASDINAGALGTARRNAKRAGVLESLTLVRADAKVLKPLAATGPGWLVANLPYGERVGERAQLGALYRAVAAAWTRELPTWRAAFYVENAALIEEAVGRPPRERFAVDNGGIHCAWLVW